MSGIGSGLGMTVGPIYISEVAPTEMRSMMTTFYNINIMGGVAGSYWINFASYEYVSPQNSWQWRATLVLQLIPTIALFIGFFFFHESPRYLMMRGRVDAARQSVLKIRGLDENDIYFSREYDELRGRVDATAEIQSAWQSTKSLLSTCITDPPTRKMLLFVMIVHIW